MICGNQHKVVRMAATAPTISNRGFKTGASQKHKSCGASYARITGCCEGNRASWTNETTAQNVAGGWRPARKKSVHADVERRFVIGHSGIGPWGGGAMTAV